MVIPFLYMTLAVDKLNGRGLSNAARCERLPKKTNAVLASEGLPGSTTSWDISIIKVIE